MSTPTILAIDPGYDRCGWAVVIGKLDQASFQYGSIETNKNETFFQRLSQVISFLEKMIQLYQPTDLAIETLFFSKNVKTAMRVAEVRGAITGLCLQHSMKIFEYSPIEVKQAATGNGKADKKAIEKMVRLQLKIPASEKLLDDTLDALAIGLTHQVCKKTKKANNI
ncbi:MAG: crossover junction endodeoxyribonuclease RuvC [Patescibacteria group bacterium]